MSSGVADEVGAGALPADFRLLRASDVFPTNNTMIRRDILGRSGLFDLAYNHRPRADGDLGIRNYLAGAFMILNPAISVLHHHAASGGLRKHKARTVTNAMSRKSIFQRVLTNAGRDLPYRSDIFDKEMFTNCFGKACSAPLVFMEPFGDASPNSLLLRAFCPAHCSSQQEIHRRLARSRTVIPKSSALPPNNRRTNVQFLVLLRQSASPIRHAFRRGKVCLG